jgi:transcriptional regulator with XRE-family HTH domain
MRQRKYDSMPLFGRRLISLRKSRGLRQEDLAKELNVSRTAISYYEGVARNPTTEFVQKVADYFGVTTDELIRDVPDKRGKPGPRSKIECQLEEIRKLPAGEQKAISTILDMALRNVRHASASL